MEDRLPGCVGTVMALGAGGWTQPDKPAEFNEALLDLIDRL